jgi:hypothetical protein
MSVGFMVWMVDLGAVRGAYRSGNEKLRRMIGGRFKRDIAQLDDMLGEGKTYGALRQIIDGSEMPKRGAEYAYALRLVVEHFGRFLYNNPLMPCGFDLPREVDKELVRLGLEKHFQLSRWMGFDPPVEIPYPDDFPSVGHMEAQAAAEAAAAFDEADLGSVADAQVAEAIRCIHDWLREARAQRWGLVSYFH